VDTSLNLLERTDVTARASVHAVRYTRRWLGDRTCRCTRHVGGHCRTRTRQSRRCCKRRLPVLSWAAIQIGRPAHTETASSRRLPTCPSNTSGSLGGVKHRAPPARLGLASLAGAIVRGNARGSRVSHVRHDWSRVRFGDDHSLFRGRAAIEEAHRACLCSSRPPQVGLFPSPLYYTTGSERFKPLVNF
jgi:hypothetical protein